MGEKGDRELVPRFHNGRHHRRDQSTPMKDFHSGQHQSKSLHGDGEWDVTPEDNEEVERGRQQDEDAGRVCRLRRHIVGQHRLSASSSGNVGSAGSWGRVKSRRLHSPRRSLLIFPLRIGIRGLCCAKLSSDRVIAGPADTICAAGSHRWEAHAGGSVP